MGTLGESASNAALSADNVADGSTNAIPTLTQETNWDAASAHVSASGASHSYIDQSVVSGSGPAFTSIQLTTPVLGTPTSGTLTNCDGTAASLVAGAVTNATFTTALTVDTGTLTLTANVANTSVLTIGAGASSISGLNTGDQDLSGYALVGQTFYIGTTQVAINRASAALTLAGITLTTPEIGAATGTSLDLGGTTLYASRAITVDTGGVLNIVLASASGDDFTVDTDKLVVEGDTGNVGVGTATPSARLHISDAGGTVGSNSRYTFTATNQYYDLAFYENATNVATIQAMGSAYGTVSRRDNLELWTRLAGGSITFHTNSATPGVIIQSDGKVAIGVATSLAKLHIDQSVSNAAIPTLILDQADVSEGTINFIASARGTGSTTAGDIAESVRVELNGTIYRLALYSDA